MSAGRSYKIYVFSALLAGALLVLLYQSKERSPFGERGVEQAIETPSIQSPPVKAGAPQENLRSGDEKSSMTTPKLLPSPSSRSEEHREVSERDMTAKKEDLSWFYEPQFDREFSVSDQRYDSVLLDEAEHQRDHANSWRENTFKPFNVPDIFFSKIRPLGDPLRAIEFKLKLKRNEERTDILPEWIQFAEKGRAETMTLYENFVSKFSEQEVYVGLLVFPYDSFWKQIEPKSHCDEIALIYDGLVSHQDKDRITGFDGRVFCRTSLRNLRGIAHFSATTNK